MKAISYIDRRDGRVKSEKVPGEKIIRWLYQSAAGKLTLNALLKRKFISAWAGRYMDSRRSVKRISPFVKTNNIDLNECLISELTGFSTFNEFFCRKLKINARSIGEHLVSPADGKILVFPTMDDVTAFFVKGLDFTLSSFLQNKTLAKKYSGGSMAIVRLAPADYHRYHFPASGEASASKKIMGHYYSVSPMALSNNLRIFCENRREYCMLTTSEFGNILLAEVGAAMVGSIIQTYTPGNVEKGSEKGYFAFGGSSLVLLFEEGKIKFDNDLVINTKKGLETSVRMGENIAK